MMAFDNALSARRMVSLILVLALPTPSFVEAFTNGWVSVLSPKLRVGSDPSTPAFVVGRSSSLFLSKKSGRGYSDDNGYFSDGEDEPYYPKERTGWKLHNDFYMFVNQCSIQSFTFLLRSMRDPHTVLWMENFTQPSIGESERPSNSQKHVIVDPETGKTKNAQSIGKSEDCLLLNYHGLHAMNTTRFPTWDSYFSEMIKCPVETFTIESSLRYVPDYDLEINPPRLCNRLMSVREQISREFAHDLQVLSKMGDETLEAYWKKVHELADRARGKRDYQDPDEKDGREIKISPTNLMFLDLSPGGSYQGSSPLRKGSFDLLKLLATQESIHRLLNDEERQKGAEAVANQYLKDFYAARLLTYFSGNQEYGRADALIHELLASSPVMRQAKGITALVDPTRLAELILDTRKRVSLEWKALSNMVPDEHLAIRRLQLSHQIAEAMMGTASGSVSSSFEEALRRGNDVSGDKSATMPLVVQSEPGPVVRAAASKLNKKKKKKNNKRNNNNKNNNNNKKSKAKNTHEVVKQLVNVTSVFE